MLLRSGALPIPAKSWSVTRQVNLPLSQEEQPPHVQLPLLPHLRRQLATQKRWLSLLTHQGQLVTLGHKPLRRARTSV